MIEKKLAARSGGGYGWGEPLRHKDSRRIVPQLEPGGELNKGFLIEALIATENIWSALPAPLPLLARELIAGLEETETWEAKCGG